MVRAYTVMLSLGYDQVKVFYTLRDNDQRVRVATQAEYPTGAEDKKAQLKSGGLADFGNENSEGRRLLLQQSLQTHEMNETFAVEEESFARTGFSIVMERSISFS